MIRTPTTLFALYTVCLLALSSGVVRELIALSRSNNTASHVILVPLVTLVLIYQSRERIFSTVEYSVRAGSLVVLTGLAIFLVASLAQLPLNAGDSLSLRVAGLVVASIGGFVLFYGGHATRAAVFPLAFLAFTVPFPSAVIDGATYLLKAGSTETVAGLFSMTGTPYFRQGYVFSLPGVAIEVADECSGIRSSIGLLLTGLLAGHTFLQKPWPKVLIILAILPVAVLKNGIRIVTLTLLAMHVDPSFLTGQLHHEGGIVFFLLALVILAPVLVFLRRSELRAERAHAH